MILKVMFFAIKVDRFKQLFCYLVYFCKWYNKSPLVLCPNSNVNPPYWVHPYRKAMQEDRSIGQPWRTTMETPLEEIPKYTPGWHTLEDRHWGTESVLCDVFKGVLRSVLQLRWLKKCCAIFFREIALTTLPPGPEVPQFRCPLGMASGVSSRHLPMFQLSACFYNTNFFIEAFVGTCGGIQRGL
jgi:hypothetical protein